MHRYLSTQQKLRSLFHSVCEDKGKGNPTAHDDWPLLIEIAQDTNEITGIEFHTSCNEELPVMCWPKFISGFDDPYLKNRSFVLTEKKDEIIFPHRKHWRYEDYQALYELVPSVDAVKAAFIIAEKVIKPHTDLVLFSNTISGRNEQDRVKNLKKFNQAIVDLSGKNFNVFNQLVLESLFGKVHFFHIKGEDNDKVFMDNFFRPLLESGKFAALVQGDNWQASKNAVDEYKIAKECNIEIIPYKVAMAA